MKKIAINTCFGGFGLSDKAIVKYAEYSNLKLYSKQGTIDIEYYTSPGFENNTFFWKDDIPRDDPIQIKVIEEMGEQAFGDFAALEIVEIPDDIDWNIDNYDGMESVEEKHRTWR